MRKIESEKEEEDIDLLTEYLKKEFKKKISVCR